MIFEAEGARTAMIHHSRARQPYIRATRAKRKATRQPTQNPTRGAPQSRDTSGDKPSHCSSTHRARVRCYLMTKSSSVRFGRVWPSRSYEFGFWISRSLSIQRATCHSSFCLDRSCHRCSYISLVACPHVFREAVLPSRPLGHFRWAVLNFRSCRIAWISSPNVLRGIDILHCIYSEVQ